ncbi:spermidine synthase [Prauserella sediminis]|uniref:Spermidine synthase n=2 Tax=Prauserella sediminis TaxID=577680 RepID=A0A839XJ91_9PSEU|nr:spermidine synthase [Prauserella sediminis]
MTMRFQELDWQQTPMGELSLRVRRDPALDREVHEIKLNDEFLMSSLFTVSETELGRRAVSRLDGTDLDVAVGGLGLGCTAAAVLDDDRVRSLVVVEALAPVIDWHERALLPAGGTLAADPRCRFVHGDFFAMVASEQGLDPQEPGRRFDAVVVDIDHSPRHVLHESHTGFYLPEGLAALRDRLRPGGVFALWSDDRPDDEFTATLGEQFTGVTAEVVTFDNPLLRREASSTVYLARAPR